MTQVSEVLSETVAIGGMNRILRDDLCGVSEGRRCICYTPYFPGSVIIDIIEKHL